MEENSFAESAGSGGLEVDIMHGTMMGSRMMLAEVIGKVKSTAIPVDMKMALLGTVLDPVESHGHSLGSFGFDSSLDNADGRSVITLYWCWTLRETEFEERLTDGFGFTAVVKEAAEFCLGCGGNHFLEEMSDDE